MSKTLQKKSNLKITPPNIEKERENFIAGADNKKKSKILAKNEVLPWNKNEVNERVIKTFNIRMTEPDFLKLKYVVELTNSKSTHAFCTKIIQDEIARHLSQYEI